jgi:hypothetical protein
MADVESRTRLDWQRPALAEAKAAYALADRAAGNGSWTRGTSSRRYRTGSEGVMAICTCSSRRGVLTSDVLGPRIPISVGATRGESRTSMAGRDSLDVLAVQCMRA